MSYQFYSFLHIFFVAATLTSLGGLAVYMWLGGNRESFALRKQIGALHGIGMLVILVSGFGLIAKGGFSFGSSPWIFIKLGAWLALGAYPALVYKKKLKGPATLIGLMVIAAVAIFTVVYKPI